MNDLRAILALQILAIAAWIAPDDGLKALINQAIFAITTAELERPDLKE